MENGFIEFLSSLWI